MAVNHSSSTDNNDNSSSAETVDPSAPQAAPVDTPSTVDAHIAADTEAGKQGGNYYVSAQGNNGVPADPLHNYSNFDLHALANYYGINVTKPDPAYQSINPETLDSHLDRVPAYQQAAPVNPQINNWQNNYNAATSMSPGSVVNSKLVNSVMNPDASGGEVMGQAVQDHQTWLNSVNQQNQQQYDQNIAGIKAQEAALNSRQYNMNLTNAMQPRAYGLDPATQQAGEAIAYNRLSQQNQVPQSITPAQQRLMEQNAANANLPVQQPIDPIRKLGRRIAGIIDPNEDNN